MSYNQSRPDKSGSKYRRTGQSTGYHQQQQQQQSHRSNSSSEAIIPKAPTSQSPTAKAPGDPDLRKIPAPPNMDKQKRAQVKAWVPKKDLRNKAAADNQLMMKKEGNSSTLSENTDVKLQKQHTPPPPSQTQKSPFSNICMGATPMGAQIHPHVGVSASPHTPMQALHKAERKYQVCRVVADEEEEEEEEEAKQRKFKSILNKLTPQNFEKLLEQFKSIKIHNAATLAGVVSQIFDKALMEPASGRMYADLCFHLSGALPDDFNLENGEKITFKRLLINKCQEEFERGEEGVAGEGQTEVEREEKRVNVGRRMVCNVGLMGELYKKRIIPEKHMHHCIKNLLRDDPHEEKNIEALCKLMSTIGVAIDHPKAKVNNDAYFKKMKKMLSSKQELSSRVRFMLIINVIDLRNNKWQERNET